MTSFESMADIAVGGDHEGWLQRSCGLCCPYDDDDPRCCCNAHADAVTIVVGRVAATGGPVQEEVPSYKHAQTWHADFETLLCFQLRASGNPTFAHVHDCSFNFVYKPSVVGQSTLAASEI